MVPQSADSSAEQGFGSAGPQLSRRPELVHPQVDAGEADMERNAGPIKNDICGQHKRGTQQRDIGGCTSSPLPKATKTNLSFYDFSPL